MTLDFYRQVMASMLRLAAEVMPVVRSWEWRSKPKYNSSVRLWQFRS